MKSPIRWFCLVGLSILGAGCGEREEPPVEPDTVMTLPDFVALPGRLKDAPPPVNAPPAVPTFGTATPGNELSPVARESVRKAKRFTALVEVSTVKEGNPTGRTGAAFCIDRSGLFVTHARVVEGVTQDKGQVRLILDNDGPSRRVYFAKLLRSDERSGLALLEINFEPNLKLEPLTLADEAAAAVGLDVDSVTYPVGTLDVAAVRHARPGDDVARFRFNYGYPYFYRFPDIEPRQGRVIQVHQDADQIALLRFEYDGNNSPSPGAPVLDRAGKLVGVAAPPNFGGGYMHCAVPASEVAAVLKSTRSGADLARADQEHFEVVRKGKKATALVETDTNRGNASGSAFCIGPTGLFITNAHVVKNARDVRLILDSGEPNQRVVRAEVLRRDDVVDLALLQGDVRSGLEPLEIARDADLYPTMRVVTFGFPFGVLLAFHDGDRGKRPEVTIGVSRITSLRTSVHPGQLETVQFDNQLNPGNSGGPVLDRHGKVVGVATATILGASINFAIPAGRLSAFLRGAELESPGARP